MSSLLDLISPFIIALLMTLTYIEVNEKRHVTTKNEIAHESI